MHSGFSYARATGCGTVLSDRSTNPASSLAIAVVYLKTGVCHVTVATGIMAAHALLRHDLLDSLRGPFGSAL